MGLLQHQSLRQTELSINVPADKAKYLETLAKNASVSALKILADGSAKPGMEAKLMLAKTLGQI